MEKIYRPNVGIALYNTQGLFWVGQYNTNRFNSWQMPQGGIEPGDTIEKTILKELYEETGITKEKIEIIHISNKKRYYDLPKEIKKPFDGQEQTWVLIKFNGKNSDINLSTQDYDEFKDWRWATSDEVLNEIVDYKKEIYIDVFKEFLPLIKKEK